MPAFPRAIEDVGDDEARLAFAAVVLGPTRLAGPVGGRIVNMTTPLTGSYRASKHALEALSYALRVELAADGIARVLIEPGAFRSSMWESAQWRAAAPRF